MGSKLDLQRSDQMRWISQVLLRMVDTPSSRPSYPDSIGSLRMSAKRRHKQELRCGFAEVGAFPNVPSPIVFPAYKGRGEVRVLGLRTAACFG